MVNNFEWLSDDEFYKLSIKLWYRRGVEGILDCETVEEIKFVVSNAANRHGVQLAGHEDYLKENMDCGQLAEILYAAHKHQRVLLGLCHSCGDHAKYSVRGGWDRRTNLPGEALVCEPCLDVWQEDQDEPLDAGRIN